MLRYVDLRQSAPARPVNWRAEKVANAPKLAACPPNAVVMACKPGRVPLLVQVGSRQFRDGAQMVAGYRWWVRGLDFVEADEAMAFADRLAKTEGRPVWIET